MTGDGVVNLADRDEWLAVAEIENGFASPGVVGDTDLDGVVNAFDLNNIAVNWLQDVAIWSSGDFNADGGVNAADLDQIGIHCQRSSTLRRASRSHRPTCCCSSYQRP